MSWVIYWKKKHSVEYCSSPQTIWTSEPSLQDSKHVSIAVLSSQNWAPLPSCWPPKPSCSVTCFWGLTSEATETSEKFLGKLCKFTETSSVSHMKSLQHSQWVNATAAATTTGIQNLLKTTDSRFTFSKNRGFEGSSLPSMAYSYCLAHKLTAISKLW